MGKRVCVWGLFNTVTSCTQGPHLRDLALRGPACCALRGPTSFALRGPTSCALRGPTCYVDIEGCILDTAQCCFYGSGDLPLIQVQVVSNRRDGGVNCTSQLQGSGGHTVSIIRGSLLGGPGGHTVSIIRGSLLGGPGGHTVSIIRGSLLGGTGGHTVSI